MLSLVDKALEDLFNTEGVAPQSLSAPTPAPTLAAKTLAVGPGPGKRLNQ